MGMQAHLFALFFVPWIRVYSYGILMYTTQISPYNETIKPKGVDPEKKKSLSILYLVFAQTALSFQLHPQPPSPSVTSPAPCEEMKWLWNVMWHATFVGLIRKAGQTRDITRKWNREDPMNKHVSGISVGFKKNIEKHVVLTNISLNNLVQSIHIW